MLFGIGRSPSTVGLCQVALQSLSYRGLISITNLQIRITLIYQLQEIKNHMAITKVHCILCGQEH